MLTLLEYVDVIITSCLINCLINSFNTTKKIKLLAFLKIFITRFQYQMLLNARTFDVSIQDPQKVTVVSLKKCIFLVILLSRWSNGAPPSLVHNFSLIPKSADENVPVHSYRRCFCIAKLFKIIGVLLIRHFAIPESSVFWLLWPLSCQSSNKMQSNPFSLAEQQQWVPLISVYALQEYKRKKKWM